MRREPLSFKIRTTMKKNIFRLKNYFWPILFCAIPLSILSGFLAWFHVFPVHFNDTPTYGFKGFIVPVCFIPFWGLLFSVINWMTLNFGYFLYDSFLKAVKKKQE
jgi:hypothetical protein